MIGLKEISRAKQNIGNCRKMDSEDHVAVFRTRKFNIFAFLGFFCIVSELKYYNYHDILTCPYYPGISRPTVRISNVDYVEA